MSTSEPVRLQKVLAAAGVASRRASEELIVRGQVEVNGEVVTELGTRIDPERDRVRVNGRVIQLDVSKRYFMLNKPTGVVSSLHDEHGRPDLRQFTEEFEERLFNVGRLDADTSGLLLLTNDGELANVLAHPKFGVEKTYIATVAGIVAPATLQRLRDGITLEDGDTRFDRARVLQSDPRSQQTMVEVTLHSGKNRIVRRMFAAVNHRVIGLVRRQFGPLHLGTLRVGKMRELTRVERGELLTIAENSLQKDQP